MDIKKGNSASIAYTYYIESYHFAEKTGDQGEITVTDNKAVIEDNSIKVTGKSTVVVSANSQGQLYIKPSITIDAMPVKSVRGIIQPTIDETTSNVNLDNLPDFCKMMQQSWILPILYLHL